jgi:hypothetical protein
MASISLDRMAGEMAGVRVHALRKSIAQVSNGKNKTERLYSKCMCTYSRAFWQTLAQKLGKRKFLGKLMIFAKTKILAVQYFAQFNFTFPDI